MIQNKTRIRVTWYILIICLICILIGWSMKETSVIMTSLGSAVTIGMTYIGGKSINNQAIIKIKKEV